jgi:hypothetical protein
MRACMHAELHLSHTGYSDPVCFASSSCDFSSPPLGAQDTTDVDDVVRVEYEAILAAKKRNTKAK